MIVVSQSIIEKRIVAVQQIVERAIFLEQMTHHRPRLFGKFLPHQPLFIEPLVEHILRHDRRKFVEPKPFGCKAVNKFLGPRISNHAKRLRDDLSTQPAS